MGRMRVRGGAECRTKDGFAARAVLSGRNCPRIWGFERSCDSDYSAEKIPKSIELEHGEAEDDIKDEFHFQSVPRLFHVDFPEGVKFLPDGDDCLTGIENKAVTLGAYLDFHGANGNRLECMLSTLGAGQVSF